MTGSSLHLRLLVASAVTIVFALIIVGFAFVRVFETEVSSRVERELSNHLLQLAGALETDSNGKFYLARQLADPRFQQPFSGLYWQISGDGQEPLRSRSLWDESLTVPALQGGGRSHILQFSGPDETPLIALQRVITVTKQSKPSSVTLIVGTNASEVTDPLESFTKSLALSLAALAIFLAAAAWVQAKVGLLPLETIRSGLGKIRKGELTRLSGHYPAEIAPLVEEFNGVLETQEKTISRSRARAADLAHGLKTPLTILSAVARDLNSKGRSKVANEISEQAEAMHIVVERELSRSRLAQGRGNATVDVAREIERLVASVRRLPPGEKLQWKITVPAGTSAPIERVDLVELLGNIFDNARKWARNKIAITTSEVGDGLALVVEDDGPGVEMPDITRIMERGFSLDKSAKGTGLGLTIVRDIAEIYDLQVGFSRSQLGGLTVTIFFPSRQAIGVG